jgi:hypothetical protein
VDDPYPAIHRLASGAAIQPGDLREHLGLQPFGLWSDFPSVMAFGHTTVSQIFGNPAAALRGFIR